MSLGGTCVYRVDAGDVERDADELAGLWHDQLGDPGRMAAKYQWFYRDAEAGPPLVGILRLEAGDEAVGTCTAGRRRMSWDGEATRAGILVDFAVLPRHRTLGPALILQRGVLAAARHDFDLLYGFPNARAAPVFARTGYREIGRMVRHVRVLRHGPYLRPKLPAWLAVIVGGLADAASRLALALRLSGLPKTRVEWVDAADTRMDQVWACSTCPDGLVGVRDAAFLRWRFDRSPLAATRYLLVSRRGDSEPDAWFAVERDGPTLQVRDFWSRAGGPKLADWHVAALLTEARKLSALAAVSVAMATTGPALVGWQRLAFRERDSRPVFATSTDPSRALHPALEFHFTAADEDE